MRGASEAVTTAVFPLSAISCRLTIAGLTRLTPMCPGNDATVFQLGGIERLKQWGKAEPSFNKALELYPDQPQVLNYLGYSWVDMGIHLDRALDMIKKAVELRPQDGYIVDSLGWAYYKLGRYDEAVVELEKAVKLRPEDPTINDHMGDAYWRVGRQLEATFQWHHAIAASLSRKISSRSRKS